MRSNRANQSPAGVPGRPRRRAPGWLLCVVVAALAAGCGDNSGAGAGSAGGDAGGEIGTMPDGGFPDGQGDGGGGGLDGGGDGSGLDGGGGGDVPPAVAGEPALILVSLQPSRAVYSPGRLVTPEAVVYDQLGDEMEPDEPPRWTVEPESGAELDGDRWRLLREGEVTFKACIPLDEEGALNLCGERTIIVDTGPPTLEIFTPEAGAELLAEEHPAIIVTGRATDSHGVVRAFVNGQRVFLDADGNFSMEVRPVFGVNHIEVVATDALSPSETRVGIDVLWAPHYYPLGTSPGGTVLGVYPNALLMQLNQRYLDADEPVVVPEGATEVVAHDFAGLLEFVLAEVDLMSQIPDPISDSDSFTMRVTEAGLGDPTVDIRVTEEGLELFVSMPDVVVLTEGAVTLTDTPLSLAGGAFISVSAFVDLIIHKDSADEPMVVDLDGLQLALENATPFFESEAVNAIFELAEGAVFSAVENLVLEAIEESFLTELPELVADAMVSIEESLTGQEFELDLGLGGAPVTITLNAGLESLLPTERTSLFANFDLDLGTTALPQFPETRGVAMRQPFEQPAPLFMSSRAQIGVRLPLLNGILHELWNSGLLRIDATDLLPEAIAFVIDRVNIDGRLPPLLTPTRFDSAEYSFVLSIGQLELLLGRAELQDRYGLNALVGANVLVEDGQLIVDIQPVPTVKMWLIAQEGEDPLFDDVAALESLFAGVIWPMLGEQLAEGLVIDLPSIDLGSIGEWTPALGALSMALVLDHPIEIREGFFILDGAFEARAELLE